MDGSVMVIALACALFYYGGRGVVKDTKKVVHGAKTHVVLPVGHFLKNKLK
jgi:hypothetical protein